VNILYRRELESADDPAALRAEKVAEFRENLRILSSRPAAASSTKSSSPGTRAPS
jgi:hypothetical protein